MLPKVALEMKAVLLMLLVGVIGWALQDTNVATSPHGLPSPAVCSIAGVPEGEIPELHPLPIAELLPSQMPKLRKAYFSMGCFWGSEAMLASCPGVIFTRVGFTGGTLPNPSYSAIGDHVETVEVSFDPDQVSYPQLLDHFWSHHNAHAKPIFRQYASAIFTEDQTQELAAKEMRESRQSSSGDRLLTAVKPLETFYPADAGHQKYYLSQDPELLERLPRHGEQKLDTRLATKLNALAAHAGQRQHIQDALSELGLSPTSTEALLQRADWPTP